MTPQWKIYRGCEYVAACKYAEDAARLVIDGDTVKYMHKLNVWTEGNEVVSAGESYDRAALIMRARRDEGKIR